MIPIFINIETTPINKDDAEKLSEDEKNKLTNPIDSKIIAIGTMLKNEENIFISDTEEDVIKSFWNFLKTNNGMYNIIGFSAKNFEMPFIVTRSFVLNIEIEPFSLKNITDLREIINSYRYGQTRGKLNEFSEILGMGIEPKELKEKLSHNLLVIKKMYERANFTKINKITRF